MPQYRSRSHVVDAWQVPVGWARSPEPRPDWVDIDVVLFSGAWAVRRIDTGDIRVLTAEGFHESYHPIESPGGLFPDKDFYDSLFERPQFDGVEYDVGTHTITISAGSFFDKLWDAFMEKEEIRVIYGEPTRQTPPKETDTMDEKSCEAQPSGVGPGLVREAEELHATLCDLLATTERIVTQIVGPQDAPDVGLNMTVADISEIRENSEPTVPPSLLEGLLSSVVQSRRLVDRVIAALTRLENEL